MKWVALIKIESVNLSSINFSEIVVNYIYICYKTECVSIKINWFTNVNPSNIGKYTNQLQNNMHIIYVKFLRWFFERGGGNWEADYSSLSSWLHLLEKTWLQESSNYYRIRATHVNIDHIFFGLDKWWATIDTLINTSGPVIQADSIYIYAQRWSLSFNFI